MTAGLATVGLLVALYWTYTKKGMFIALVVLVLGVLILGALVSPIRDFGVAGVNLAQTILGAIEAALNGDWKP